MDGHRCPLTGAPCSNPKIIHITEVHGYNAVEEQHLCQMCGKDVLAQAMPKPKKVQPKVQTIAESELSPLMKGLFDLLSSVMKAKLQEFIANEPKQTHTRPPCPTCGMTLQDVINSSRLGCGDCYEHYKNELLPVLVHVHKATEHIGKKPSSKPEEAPIEERLRILNMQLKQAIEQEHYERANEIKKQLDLLSDSA